MTDDMDRIRAREISRALNFYHEDFTRYMAIVISMTEKLPEEINNQIRDAFTHVSRAQYADSEEKIINEIKKSISHIERANRDCLKASIIYAEREVSELFSDVRFTTGSISQSLLAQHSTIIESRRKAYINETRGDSNQVEKLDDILKKYLQLSVKIKETYDIAGRPKAKITRWIRRNIPQPVQLITSSVISALIGLLIGKFGL